MGDNTSESWSYNSKKEGLMLSVITTARNDNYGGNFIERFFFYHIARQLREFLLYKIRIRIYY